MPLARWVVLFNLKRRNWVVALINEIDSRRGSFVPILVVLSEFLGQVLECLVKGHVREVTADPYEDQDPPRRLQPSRLFDTFSAESVLREALEDRRHVGVVY